MNKFDRFTSHRLHLPHFFLYGARALQTPPTTCEMIASESERVSEIKKAICVYIVNIKQTVYLGADQKMP